MRREAKDLLGIDPVGHPDPRRLVLHESFPHSYHPLRKGVDPVQQPGVEARRFDHFEVHGEGIYELPVGPIHAGVIEPGHFRFSNIGDVVLFLDARLFYTHRGIEKIVEGLTPARALFTVERTCGVCTVSHGVAFASAVERATGAVIPARAVWLRTLLLELERLYNHVGDIGNICAGTGLHAGTSRGAILKERLQRLNEALTGHRFLMGVVDIGGLRRDLEASALTEQARELAAIEADFTAYVDMLLGTGSFVHRLKGPGRLDAELVRALAGQASRREPQGSPPTTASIIRTRPMRSFPTARSRNSGGCLRAHDGAHQGSGRVVPARERHYRWAPAGARPVRGAFTDALRIGPRLCRESPRSKRALGHVRWRRGPLPSPDPLGGLR
jgi:hypothetical protein